MNACLTSHPRLFANAASGIQSNISATLPLMRQRKSPRINTFTANCDCAFDLDNTNSTQDPHLYDFATVEMSWEFIEERIYSMAKRMELAYLLATITVLS